MGNSYTAQNTQVAGTCRSPLWESLYGLLSLSGWLCEQRLGQQGAGAPTWPVPSSCNVCCPFAMMRGWSSQGVRILTLTHQPLSPRSAKDMLTNAVFRIFHMQSCPSVNDVSPPTGSPQWKEEGSVFRVCFLDHLLHSHHQVIIRSTQS